MQRRTGKYVLTLSQLHKVMGLDKDEEIVKVYVKEDPQEICIVVNNDHMTGIPERSETPIIREK